MIWDGEMRRSSDMWRTPWDDCRLQDQEWRTARSSSSSRLYLPRTRGLLPLYTNNLRRFRDMPVCRNLRQSGADRGLARGIGDQHDRHRRAGAPQRVALGGILRAALDDAFQRNIGFSHAGRDG